MGRAALFDLDRTLLDCNSGRLWVQHEWRRGRIHMGTALKAGYWLGRYSLGMDSGLEAVFEKAIARYAGSAEQEMDRDVRAWFDTQVVHRLRPGAAAAIARHREAGDQLVIATSSSPYAAGAARDAYAFHDIICTRFEVADGHFTGRVSALALGPAKADRAEEWAEASGIALGACTFYTDSATDVALLERVGTPVAVNPDRALARIAKDRGWQVEDWGVSARRSA